MNLSNENRLLLFCARTQISDSVLDQIKPLIKLPLNWQEVLDSAFSYGIAPLLYHNLKYIPESRLIPPEIMNHLKQAYHRSMARNMFFYSELRRILEIFHEKGIDVIVLKGAALAEVIYGNIALRSFGDFDLLVRRKDLLYAEEVMHVLGYGTQEGKVSQEWYRQNHHHLAPYIHPEKSTVVEIHWHIAEKFFHINIDELWERARKTKIANCDVSVLSPEDTLIHLCLHLFNHGYAQFQLRVLSDISETLRFYKDEINWAQLKKEVNKYRLSKVVYSVLYLVKKLYNSDLPNWINPAEVPIDLNLIKIVGEQTFNDDASSNIPKTLTKFIAVDKFGYKVKVLLDMVFPTREIMSKKYSVPSSSKKLYFYYLARPCILSLRYGRIALDILWMRKNYR